MTSPAAGIAVELPARELYPCRADTDDSLAERLTVAVEGTVRGTLRRLGGKGIGRILDLVAPHGDRLGPLSDQELRREAAEIRRQLHAEGMTDAAVGRSFALVRELSDRVLGLRHYDVQLLGGYALLRGMLAEMQTGEGKTLTATLPAATAALAGVPVHVVTVNEYLAGRDAKLMGALYEALGLTVAHADETADLATRRAAYRSDITYVTNKLAAFDHLRDRLVLREGGANLRLKIARLHAAEPVDDRLMMRGLHFAIVDEADSVLIDEARTPLIISAQGQPEMEAHIAAEALALARPLQAQRDYSMADGAGAIELTDAGRRQLAARAAPLGGLWTGRLRREQFVAMALSALHIYHRDEHYLVRDGRIEIVDEYTGRVMPDRRWGQGLHQMVEAKEGVPFSAQQVTLAQLTYQRFFRRYRRLAGMTGTAREVAGEIWRVYRLPFVVVPTNRPVRRRHVGTRVLPTEAEKWRAMADRAAELAGAGRPLLLGTRTVASSTKASQALAARGVPHEVLNAAQDEMEAEIVAAAGGAGTVTVATNMAGRGTDILLSDEARASGGLHVLIAELNDAGRIDRQLAGRAGRQGDPGSFEYLLSLEDPILPAGWRRSLSARLARQTPASVYRFGWLALRYAQIRVERAHTRIRRAQFEVDRKRQKSLAFAGHAD